MAVGTRMQQRRATAADWNTSNYVLAAGELGVTTDTGIIKIGDGVNGWNALEPAFDSQYLPILGTAADSELLGGVSKDYFVKVADTAVNPTNDTYVKRTADGGIKASDATENTEVTTLQQQTAAILDSTKLLVSRNLTANFTLQAGDAGKLIMVNHASTTVQVVGTVPRNSDVAFPVGTQIEICAQGAGGVKITPFDGTVGVYGKTNVMPDFGTIRLVKIDTNTWIGRESKKGRNPSYKVRRTVAGDNYSSAYGLVAYDTVDATETYNPDNEWFSIPASGMAAARRIIVNKDGEYLFNVNFAATGGSVTYCQIRKLTADNSFTGSQILAVQSLNQVCSLMLKKRVAAGETFGVSHGFSSGSTGKADAEASGGDPHNFKIIRIGD